MARRAILCFIGFVLAGGCRTGQQVRDPEYDQVSRALHRAMYAPADLAVEAFNPVIPELEGPHRVEEYIQFALQQNPEVQAARKRMEAQAFKVPIAASLQDPMLNITVQPEPVQTAAGQQELTLSASQKFPWFGKLETKAILAEAETNVARTQLAAAELGTIAAVKRAYYELYYVQQAMSVLEDEQQLLRIIRDIADTKYITGDTTQQDVLRAELELLNLENELIRLRQQLESGQARLARILHVAPHSRLLASDQLPAEDVPSDLDWLQRQAVQARPELHSKLAAIERDRHAVELTRLDYKPDVTLGLSWIDVASAGISPVANGRDAFMINAGVNLPVFQKRLDASVRSAEAQAVSTVREYDALRDHTLEEVTDHFSQANSQREMLALFELDILPKAKQTLEVSIQAYNVGKTDFLQLIDNWRVLLRYELTYQRLEASLRQTLAELERIVGGFNLGPTQSNSALREAPRPMPPPE